MTKEQIWQEWWPKQPGITEDNLTALRRGFMAGYDFGFVEGYKEADTLEPLEIVPAICILTGEEGENPDDCTTHEHEDNND